MVADSPSQRLRSRPSVLAGIYRILNELLASRFSARPGSRVGLENPIPRSVTMAGGKTASATFSYPFDQPSISDGQLLAAAVRYLFGGRPARPMF
jgi:hypothetical protein